MYLSWIIDVSYNKTWRSPPCTQARWRSFSIYRSKGVARTSAEQLPSLSLRHVSSDGQIYDGVRLSSCFAWCPAIVTSYECSVDGLTLGWYLRRQAQSLRLVFPGVQHYRRSRPSCIYGTQCGLPCFWLSRRLPPLAILPVWNKETGYQRFRSSGPPTRKALGYEIQLTSGAQFPI